MIQLHLLLSALDGGENDRRMGAQMAHYTVGSTKGLIHTVL